MRRAVVLFHSRRYSSSLFCHRCLLDLFDARGTSFVPWCSSVPAAGWTGSTSVTKRQQGKKINLRATAPQLTRLPYVGVV